MIQQNEQRKTQRAPLNVVVRWTLDGTEWHEDRSKDVSSSGMLLLTNAKVNPGAVIKMNFNLPNFKLKDPIRSEAEVVRTVERHGQQIGIGVRFVALRSMSYQTVNEFVCRIMGLPLEKGLAELGTQQSGVYSFEMEKLALEAERRKEEAINRKLAEAEEKERKKVLHLWGRRAAKLGLVLLVGFALHRVIVFFMGLASHVN